MYTAYPDLDPEIDSEITPTLITEVVAIAIELEAQEKLLERMRTWYKAHNAGDFAGCSPLAEKTTYKNQHRQLKRKGGKPPIDYNLAEQFVELGRLLEAGDLQEALPIYFSLSRIA